jgi:hypothetical protein
MTDPKRWLDEGGGGTAEERDLLESGRNVTMPSALRKRVWLGIAAGVAGVGASAGTAAGEAIGQGAASKGTLSLLLSGAGAKTVLAVALLGGAGIGVTALRSKEPATPPANASHTPSPDPVEAREAVEPAVTQPSAVDNSEATGAAPAPTTATAPEHKLRAQGASQSTATSAPRSAARSTSAPAASSEGVAPAPEARAAEAPPASRLREESAAVVAIRKTLVAGDPAEALRLLERARAEFPNGALVQEREALTVRALAESGRKDAARKRGEAFLRAFPRSPHAAEVRELIAP